MEDWELQYFSSRQAESEARCRQRSHRHTTSATRHTCAAAGSASGTELVPSPGTADPPGAATARLWDVPALHQGRGAELCLCRDKFAPQGCGHTPLLDSQFGMSPFLHPLLPPSAVGLRSPCLSPGDAEVLSSIFEGRNQRGPFKPQMN